MQNMGHETVDDTIYRVKLEIGDKIGAEIRGYAEDNLSMVL